MAIFWMDGIQYAKEVFVLDSEALVEVVARTLSKIRAGGRVLASLQTMIAFKLIQGVSRRGTNMPAHVQFKLYCTNTYIYHPFDAFPLL